MLAHLKTLAKRQCPLQELEEGSQSVPYFLVTTKRRTLVIIQNEEAGFPIYPGAVHKALFTVVYEAVLRETALQPCPECLHLSFR